MSSEVSSANRVALEYDRHSAVSLMYNKKNNGPNTDPCGTPVLMIIVSDLEPSTTVN